MSRLPLKKTWSEVFSLSFEKMPACSELIYSFPYYYFILEFPAQLVSHEPTHESLQLPLHSDLHPPMQSPEQLPEQLEQLCAHARVQSFEQLSAQWLRHP